MDVGDGDHCGVGAVVAQQVGLLVAAGAGGEGVEG
jgi:hypothetical protein